MCHVHRNVRSTRRSRKVVSHLSSLHMVLGYAYIDLHISQPWRQPVGPLSDMTIPQLSPPTLFTRSQLMQSETLVYQIITLVNDAFKRSKAHDPQKWQQEVDRFDDSDSYYNVLGEQGFVIAIFDQAVPISSENDSTPPERKLVACSAAIPWKGGMLDTGVEQENGWEVKAIAVSGDPQYLGRGLAVQILSSMELYLRQSTKLSSPPKHGISTLDDRGEAPLTKVRGDCEPLVTLWVQAAECINGPYWRRRGYKEVARKTMGQGVWSCKTWFEMLVMRKDIV